MKNFPWHAYIYLTLNTKKKQNNFFSLILDQIPTVFFLLAYVLVVINAILIGESVYKHEWQAAIPQNPMSHDQQSCFLCLLRENRKQNIPQQHSIWSVYSVPFSCGANATDLRLQRWPLKLPNSSPDFISHSLAVWSPAAVTYGWIIRKHIWRRLYLYGKRT